MSKNKRIKKKNVLYIWTFLGIVLLILIALNIKDIFPLKIVYTTGYLASSQYEVPLLNEEFLEDTKLIRGSEVKFINEIVVNEEKEYYKVLRDGITYYILTDNVVLNEKDTVGEKTVYVRTTQNLYEESTGLELLTQVKKGEELSITSFDYLNADGSVNMYKVKYGEVEGYIYNKYVVMTKELALLNYDQEGIFLTHSKRGNTYGGGNAGNLDYYPYEKVTFKDNVMPDNVYALYLNGTSGVLDNIDSYIEFAKTTKINAFVVDIKDNEQPAYESEVFKELSPTNYKYAFNTIEEYKTAITKLKEAGFYVIGRITTFKDEYYVTDHPEDGITNTSTNKPLVHQDSYWPSAYQRDVWEFNVKLAVESVKLMGFNEIQFDYVRFPDSTKKYETAKIIDYRNDYGEEKAQALQGFLFYACDVLHQLGVYVSVDVFGESAYNYVTAYGQYWASMSNIVDAISGMPYPDHFNKYEFGFSKPVWTTPYELLNFWGSKYVAVRQKEIPTPAKVRTWVQAYNTIREPYIVYGANEVSSQIKGLYDAGLNGGYMTWLSSSNLSKYKAQAEAYSKEYN